MTTASYTHEHIPGSELLQGLEEGGGSLKHDTDGFLFRLLIFHWRFPIYLSDQVIEDLKEETERRRDNKTYKQAVAALSIYLKASLARFQSPFIQ